VLGVFEQALQTHSDSKRK